MSQQAWKENYHYMASLGLESVSGTGSSVESTQEVITRLPTLLAQYNIQSMMDIPCGDHNWMHHVPLGNVKYIGADIVEDLITSNQTKYPEVDFRCLDITTDLLPPVDLIMVRDCFVHLSEVDIGRAVRNMGRQPPRYILTTTFTGLREYYDIPTTGWRTINFEKAPFNWPAPIHIINERCPEQGGIYHDKCLGLWNFSDVESLVC